jgi:hypothetical protein
VEERSIKRVEESGLFKGLTREEVRRGSRERVGSGDVESRRGVEEFLRGVRSVCADVQVCVVSLDWSREWIRSILDADFLRGHE